MYMIYCVFEGKQVQVCYLFDSFITMFQYLVLAVYEIEGRPHPDYGKATEIRIVAFDETGMFKREKSIPANYLSRVAAGEDPNVLLGQLKVVSEDQKSPEETSQDEKESTDDEVRGILKEIHELLYH